MATMLYTGEFWTGSVCTGLFDGFLETGLAVQAIDLRHYIGSPRSSILDKTYQKLFRRASIKAWKQELLRQIGILNPDYFFTIKRTVFNPRELGELRKKGVRTAIFYPDVSFDHPNVDLDALKEFDLIATTKIFHLDYLRQLCPNRRIEYIPHGFTPNAHMPLYKEVSEGQHLTDIFYAGNYSPFKKDFFEDFYTFLPSKNYKFVLTGPSWAQKNCSFMNHCYDNRLIIGLSYSEQIQLAKINLSIHCGRILNEADKQDWYDRVSTRSFEIPACGGFMLHIDNDELREFYTPGIDVDVFTTAEEAVDKATFYLYRPELRQSMIRSAFNRTVPDYSYSSRAKEIYKILSEI